MHRPLSDAMKAALVDNYKKAEIVLVSRVISVGPPPPAWSGVYASYQEVRYRVVRPLKGGLKGGAQDFSVAHPVVADSRTADPEKPGLGDALFKRDAELVLFLRQIGSRLEAIDENFGVVPATPEVFEVLEKARDAAKK